MSAQNYANHRRFVPPFHYYLASLILATTIGAAINVYKSTGSESGIYSATLILAIGIALIMLFLYSRAFALRAQDRAIRAEENFRHYLLAGKPLDSRITMRQIIGLRFAPDDEFLALAKEAAENGTSEDAIKRSIKNWRADNERA
ncbi:MAG: DUF6526 family protein [Calditrichia bacterium]